MLREKCFIRAGPETFLVRSRRDSKINTFGRVSWLENFSAHTLSVLIILLFNEAKKRRFHQTGNIDSQMVVSVASRVFS